MSYYRNNNVTISKISIQLDRHKLTHLIYRTVQFVSAETFYNGLSSKIIGVTMLSRLMPFIFWLNCSVVVFSLFISVINSLMGDM